MLLALAVQGARITSHDGKTITAEVISFDNGVFRIRRNGKVVECPSSSLSKITFETTESPGVIAGSKVKMDIVKVSANISRWDRNDWKEWTTISIPYSYWDGDRSDVYYLKPSVRINCRAIGNTFGRRPVVALRLNIQEPKSGSIEQMVLLYDWEDDYGWREAADPGETSKSQPQCALARLSPETLDKGSARNYQPIRFANRVKVLATRAEIWVGGNLVDSKTEQIDWGVPLPREWKN
jgi:hypothetical protein